MSQLELDIPFQNSNTTCIWVFLVSKRYLHFHYGKTEGYIVLAHVGVLLTSVVFDLA